MAFPIKPPTRTMQMEVLIPDVPEDDFAAAICKAIELGTLDKSLRDIARAAFVRQQVLDGNSGKRKVGDERSTGKVLKAKLGDVRPAFDDEPRKATAPTVVADDHWPIQPVSPEDADIERDIKIGARWYRRRELVGRSFVVKPGTMRSSEFDGQVATITGAGPKALKVKYHDPNLRSGPDSMTGEGFISHSNAKYLYKHYGE